MGITRSLFFLNEKECLCASIWTKKDFIFSGTQVQPLRKKDANKLIGLKKKSNVDFFSPPIQVVWD